MAEIEQDSTQRLLKDLRNIIAKEGNGRTCIGYQTLAVTNSAVLKLTLPVSKVPMSAEITIEPDSASTNTATAIRYTIDGSTPVTGTADKLGVPLGDYDTIEILGNTNLVNFRVIAVDAASTKYLKIHYFA